MTRNRKSFVFMAAALAKNGGIGYKNGLPWSIPGDWEYFQNITTKAYGDQKVIYESATEWNNVVILGRLSYESRPMLSEPLENRFNIVVSRNTEYKLKESPIAGLTNSLNEAFDKANQLVKEEGRIFVLGGEEIYRQSILLPECTHLLITEVHCSVSISCDTFIPKIDPDLFRLANHQELESFVKENIPKGRQQFQHFEYEFVLYIKNE